MAPSPSDLLVRVTAGPTYDPATHHVVHINSGSPNRIESSTCTLDLSVRIQDYHGDY